MPITHDRLETLATAALDILKAYQSLVATVRAEHKRFVDSALEDGGTYTADRALAQVVHSMGYTTPDPTGIAVVGREAENVRLTKNRNLRSKARMRQLRMDRGLATPPPDPDVNYAYTPRDRPLRPQAHGSRGGHAQPGGFAAMRDYAAAQQDHRPETPTRATWAPSGGNSDFDLIPEAAPPDFSAGLFGQGTGPATAPPVDPEAAFYASPEYQRAFDAVMDNAALSHDEKVEEVARIAPPRGPDHGANPEQRPDLTTPEK